MKTKFNLLFVLALSFLATSCLVDDEVATDSYSEGSNLVGFTSASRTLSGIADGSEYDFSVNLSLTGPTSETTQSGDIEVMVSVDPASTAIEGTHFVLPSTTTTLTKDGNYIGSLPITLITTGIVPPLAENPVLILNVEDVNGNNVIVNGRTGTVTLTIIYQCFADLGGTYSVTNDFCAPNFTTTIAPDGSGGWLIGSADGGFLHQCTSNTSLLNPGNIVELCGDILPSTALQFGSDGGYGIGDILGGTWDQDAGILTMQHQDVFFNGGPYNWTSVYTRQ